MNTIPDWNGKNIINRVCWEKDAPLNGRKER